MVKVCANCLDVDTEFPSPCDRQQCPLARMGNVELYPIPWARRTQGGLVFFRVTEHQFVRFRGEISGKDRTQQRPGGGEVLPIPGKAKTCRPSSFVRRQDFLPSLFSRGHCGQIDTPKMDLVIRKRELRPYLKGGIRDVNGICHLRTVKVQGMKITGSWLPTGQRLVGPGQPRVGFRRAGPKSEKEGVRQSV